jgi:hypothetical protein
MVNPWFNNGTLCDRAPMVNISSLDCGLILTSRPSPI